MTSKPKNGLQDELEAIAASYEEKLAANPSDGTALRELLVLYWQCAEFGYWANNDLQRAFVCRAQSRLGELLPLARSSQSADCRFWARYIAWVDYGDALELEECHALIREGSLDAALFPYSASNGSECRAPAERLLESVKHQRTVREQYILSVIEGTRRRRK